MAVGGTYVCETCEKRVRLITADGEKLHVGVNSAHIKWKHMACEKLSNDGKLTFDPLIHVHIIYSRVLQLFTK